MFARNSDFAAVARSAVFRATRNLKASQPTSIKAIAMLAMAAVKDRSCWRDVVNESTISVSLEMIANQRRLMVVSVPSRANTDISRRNARATLAAARFFG